MTFVYVNISRKKIFEENLTNVVVNAANQWKNISTVINRLSKSDFSINISFLAKNITGASVEFEIFGASIDVGGNYEK